MIKKLLGNHIIKSYEEETFKRCIVCSNGCITGSRMRK